MSLLAMPADRLDSRPWTRLACLLAGTALLADALLLMGLGIFSLGVTLPFLIGVALVAMAAAWPRLQGWLDQGRHRRLWRGAWAVFGVWVLSVLLFWAVLARLTEPAQAAGPAPAAIIVLGSGTPGGKVSPVLAARLDTAMDVARRFPQARVVASGGIDFRETRSEGAIMGDYLRAKGLEPARIAQEERSTSTEENLLFSGALLRAQGIDGRSPIIVVTSDFHTLRAMRIARHTGFVDVRAAGAPTPLYVRYNAWLREYFALASSFVLGELA